MGMLYLGKHIIYLYTFDIRQTDYYTHTIVLPKNVQWIVYDHAMCVRAEGIAMNVEWFALLEENLQQRRTRKHGEDIHNSTEGSAYCDGYLLV